MYCRAHKTATLTPIQHTVPHVGIFLVLSVGIFDPSLLPNADVVYGRPLIPLTSYFQSLMMLLRTIKHFCETTSVHGLGFIVEAKSSLIKRIAWFFIFIISISYAGNQLIENMDSKLTLST